MHTLLAPPTQPSLPGFPPIEGNRGGGGGATIAVTLKFSALAFRLRRRRPVVTIDDHQVAAHWGRISTPVAPGPHEVHVHVPARTGVAELTVAALPGQTLELEYRAPALAFLPGALGAPPQKYPGLAASILLLVLVMLLVVCGGIAAIISIVSG